MTKKNYLTISVGIASDKVSHYVALLGQQLGLLKQQTRTFQNSITLYKSFRFLLHHDLLSKPERLTRELIS